MYFFHAPEGAVLRNKIVIVIVIDRGLLFCYIQALYNDVPLKYANDCVI